MVFLSPGLLSIMPAYTFFCNSCNNQYEIVCSIREYHDKIPCEKCGSVNVNRMYGEDIPTQNTSVKKSDSELKTVGDLAKRNTDRMSNDHKEYLKQKHNDYKDNKETKELPKGMSRINKPKTKTKWI